MPGPMGIELKSPKQDRPAATHSKSPMQMVAGPKILCWYFKKQTACRECIFQLHSVPMLIASMMCSGRYFLSCPNHITWWSITGLVVRYLNQRIRIKAGQVLSTANWETIITLFGVAVTSSLDT